MGPTRIASFLRSNRTMRKEEPPRTGYKQPRKQSPEIPSAPHQTRNCQHQKQRPNRSHCGSMAHPSFRQHWRKDMPKAGNKKQTSDSPTIDCLRHAVSLSSRWLGWVIQNVPCKSQKVDNLKSNSGLPAVLAHLRPIFLRRQNRHNLEINQIGPAVDPCLKSITILCFHHLETAGIRRIHPTRMINNTVRQHPAITNKSFPDRMRITILEIFDDHEKHGRHYSRTPFPIPN